MIGEDRTGLMGAATNFRDMNLRVFAGEPIPHVLFQPRFEPWYDWQLQFGHLPEQFRDKSLREVYDALQVSMRYVHYYTGMPDPVLRGFSPDVKIRVRSSETQRTWIYETPLGELSETSVFTVDGTWRVVDFPVKGPDDLKKLRWLLRHMTYSFSDENFETGSAYLGDRGEPQFWVPKSPYQALAQQWMRFESFIYALADVSHEIEETMRLIDTAYDRLYEEITAAGSVKIVNFGENLHAQLLSQRYFERYLIPFYEKRANQLREAGIYTHVHVDGYFSPLLEYLKDLPFDGLEALTPEPQGDVTLEEIKEHIGDKVLLDGIPAVLFLPTYSRAELMETTEKIVELFHPRLVLGVSDEVPQGAEPEEAVARMQMVSDWCRAYRTHPKRGS
jgi:hypothetical protein